MVQTTFTIAPRTYPIGTTSLTRNVNPNIVGVAVTLDCTNWATTPTVTELILEIDLSYDHGSTWVPSGAEDISNPPPWVTPKGTTSTMSLASGWESVTQPTNIRFSLTVIGTTSIDLGQAVITAQ